MPRSSRHKSHKSSKHSSKEYSESEEDVKMKDGSSKDGSTRWDSASGEKRKISSHVRQVKDSKDLGGHGNFYLLEEIEYASSKRRKEKSDVAVGKEMIKKESSKVDSGSKQSSIKGESFKVDSRSKESSIKGESLRSESKSRKHESGIASERKEESFTFVAVCKEESNGELKRKSERDYSVRKGGKESKDKDRQSEKKNRDQESKLGHAEMKLVDVSKKQGTGLADYSEERQGKLARKNSECPLVDESRSAELEKEGGKRIRGKEDSSEIYKHYDYTNKGDEKQFSSKGICAKDVRYRDDKHKDGSYTDNYQEDGHKDNRLTNSKRQEESARYDKNGDNNYRENGEKDARRSDSRHCEGGDRENRHKNEKYWKDGERDSKLKDGKYREGTKRERLDGHGKLHEDGERGRRHEGDQYHEYADNDQYHDNGGRDRRDGDNNYREAGDRDYRHKEKKYHEYVDWNSMQKDSKQGDGPDKEKRPIDTKHRDHPRSSEHSREKSYSKHTADNGYPTDHDFTKSSAYDDISNHGHRVVRCQDDHKKREINEKDCYGDNKSRGASSERMVSATERGRRSSRNMDLELISSHCRRWGSPHHSSVAAGDQCRVSKTHESEYKDHYEERVQQNVTTATEYSGADGGSEKTSSWALEKLGQKDDGYLGESSAERHLKSDIHSSPLVLVDKSPLSNDKRKSHKSNVRRSIDVEESAQRSTDARDVKDYSGKEGRGSRESAMHVLPGDEISQADPETLSVSSPFKRNIHFSHISKSWQPQPPPFKTEMYSHLVAGSVEDDNQRKSNILHRRVSNPDVRRIQGNAWRGVPSWPSPAANGFLPFAHAPPPSSFHSAMQPFSAPPMFGVRPLMELSHPSLYHMPDVDKFCGPGRPMGWHIQGDGSCLPIHVWDASGTVSRNESNVVGRPDWNHSKNLSGIQSWETSLDLSKGPNRTASMEMPSSGKENSAPIADEAVAGQSMQPAQIEQTLSDQQAESPGNNLLSKSFDKINVEAATLFILEEKSDAAKMSRKDDVCLCHVYLSKLDISEDLAEPSLFNQCSSLIGIAQSIFSDIGDSKNFYMEEAKEAKVAVPHKFPSSLLIASVTGSVLQQAMSLYKRQKEDFTAEDGEKLKNLSKCTSNSDKGQQNTEVDKSEELFTSDGIAMADGLEEGHSEASQKKIDRPVANIMDKSNLLDTKCCLKVNSEASEAMMPESVVSGPVNLSRIHHSPESTH